VLLHPEAVNLASERDVAELYGYAADTGCTHVFVDTFRANAVGVKESDNTEVGVVIAGALHARDELGVSTLYADHTGHAGERAVGAEAKWANVDYALMVHMPNGSRSPEQQRTLRVEKMKDSETGGEWNLRLRPVSDVRDGDNRPSAVLEVGDVTATGSNWFAPEGVCWTDELPEEITEKFSGQAGKGPALDLVRILRFVRDPDGATPAELKAALKEGPRTFSESALRAGIALLKKTRVVIDGSTPARLALDPRWLPKAHLKSVP
jgi:hypothetical protein